MQLTRAEIEARIPELRIIDDTMSQIFFDGDIPCVETVLQTILAKDDLRVLNVKLEICYVETQRTVHNFGGREVKLDVYAEDSSGKRFNIELQRTKKGASLRRACLNLSLMDARALEKGDDPDKLPDTFIIFVTEKDFFDKGVTMWEAPRMYLLDGKATGERADDGSRIIYVNAEYADTDTSAIGQLMKDFMNPDPKTIRNAVLRKRMAYLKDSKEGQEKMCKVMEELNEIALKRERLSIAADMVRAGQLNKEGITRFFGFPPAEAAQIYAQNAPQPRI